MLFSIKPKLISEIRTITTYNKKMIKFYLLFYILFVKISKLIYLEPIIQISRATYNKKSFIQYIVI